MSQSAHLDAVSMSQLLYLGWVTPKISHFCQRFRWDDPVMLSNLGAKLGNTPMAAASAAAATRTAAPPVSAPEVNDLFDAAKCAP